MNFQYFGMIFVNPSLPIKTKEAQISSGVHSINKWPSILKSIMNDLNYKKGLFGQFNRFIYMYVGIY